MRLDGLYCPLWPVVVPRELKSAVDTLSSRHSPAPTPAETKSDGRSFTVAVGALQRWQHKCRAKVPIALWDKATIGQLGQNSEEVKGQLTCCLLT